MFFSVPFHPLACRRALVIRFSPPRERREREREREREEERERERKSESGRVKAEELLRPLLARKSSGSAYDTGR